MMTSSRFARYSSLFLRLALGASLLSAVADRFGLWGSYGHPHVAWGNFGRFVQYTGQLNWFLPHVFTKPLAWISTVLEAVLGVLLILGLYPRIVALAAGLLLLAFAVAMTCALGVKAPLDLSVFTASAGAFLLAAISSR
jgi:uncharacterized membrane protein YphA (DoxX/SURF4 family)